MRGQNRLKHWLEAIAIRSLFIPLLLCGFTEIDFGSFEVLMGKHTEHWRHVTQPEDREFLERAKALYEKNKGAQWTQEGDFKIPPTVHFIWIGPQPFPPQSVENVRTWMARHPGWTFKFWTDREREAPCEGMQCVNIEKFSFSKLGRCYENSQNWGEKSDILRYEILYQEGGVYADHDANSLRSFLGMHKGYDFFCCLETPHEPFVGRNVTCGNGLIGARPYHPTVKQVIDLIADRWDRLGDLYRGKDAYSRAEIVMRRTYIALSDAVLTTTDFPGNVDIILPAAYFFSKTGIPSLYSKHFYATAWDESRVKKSTFEAKGEKVLHKIHQKNRNVNLLILGLIGINCAVLGFVFVKKGFRE